MGGTVFTVLSPFTICLFHILKIKHTLKNLKGGGPQREKHTFIMERYGGQSVNQVGKFSITKCMKPDVYMIHPGFNLTIIKPSHLTSD